MAIDERAAARRASGGAVADVELLDSTGSVGGKRDVRLLIASSSSLRRLLRFFDTYVLIEVLLLSSTLAVVSKLVDFDQVVLGDLLFNNAVNGVVTGHVLLFVTKKVVQWAVHANLNPDNVAPIVITTFGDLITIPVIVLVVQMLIFIVGTFGKLAQHIVTLGVFVYLALMLVRLWRSERVAMLSIAGSHPQCVEFSKSCCSDIFFRDESTCSVVLFNVVVRLGTRA
jgi:hypothetical protein